MNVMRPLSLDRREEDRTTNQRPVASTASDTVRIVIRTNLYAVGILLALLAVAGRIAGRPC